MSPSRSIHSLTHPHLKTMVKRVLAASSKGVLSRQQIAVAIRQSTAEESLTRNEKEQFKIRVNRAIGSLQQQVPAVVTPLRGNADKIKLVRHRKRSDGITRKALMLAIRERVVSVRYQCAGCDEILEVTEFYENPQCSGCSTYAVPE